MEALRQQISAMRQSFFDEDILDTHIFQLEQVEHISDPSLFEDFVNVYLRDSTKTLAIIEEEMANNPVNYMDLDKYFHQLKSSCNCIGANKVVNEAKKAIELCKEENLEAAKASFEKMKVEHTTLKTKLQAYLELVAQLGSA
ncbi:histidine-containing phosphotransfer protein 5 [Citrus sinensis]|uniref:Histidine-containing phosphotransfer protein 5 n=1 Tax=Citrus sinensis TaxID=2711 RepID=A0ACB8IJT0_CITSI|nr:histidine-containing phosphotransfer protein 5 [Citrus sinensis]